MNPTTLAALEAADRYETQRQACPPAGFPALPEVPGGRYTRQDFFELEKQAVWRQSWVCVGLENQVKNPGDYTCWDKLDAPIILVRGMDNVLRAFMNTCRHRGARLTSQDTGNVRHLRCQYHSWSYKLTGELMGVPDERDFIHLNKADKGLLALRCDVWNGLVFVTNNKDAPAVAESLGQITQDFSTIDINALRVVQHTTMHLKCNWKAGVDAFLESYHVKTIHKDTVSQMLNVDGTVMTLLENGHSRMVMPRKHSDRDPQKNVNFNAHANAPDIEGMHATFAANSHVYHVFPNMIIPLEKSGFPILRFWPLGKDECEMEVIFLGPDWGDGERPPIWDYFMQVFNKIMAEDVSCLASIQKSLKSDAFTGMMLNYQERRIYWLHEQIDRCIGVDKLPPELAVKQVLRDYMTMPFEQLAVSAANSASSITLAADSSTLLS